MIKDWNKLPADCVNASSVNMFKNRTDRYLPKMGHTSMTNGWTPDTLIAAMSACLVKLNASQGSHVKLYICRENPGSFAVSKLGQFHSLHVLLQFTQLYK